jgi:serine/arginine repetitive matrix protein 2
LTQVPTPTPQSPKSQESQPPESPNTEQSRAALQLLFSAANDLGLDQNALTDLLSRSGSVTSRNLLNRSNSVAHSAPGASSAGPVSKISSTGSDQTTTPTNSSYPPSQLELKADSLLTPDDSTPTLQKNRKPDLLRRPKDGQTENNPVVRITRVFANDAPELATLMNRKSPNRRKRVSTASVSSRSIHDRVPTPPPPKAAKRFSADRMPPVPLLPNGLGQGGPPLSASASITNHLQSTCDSL